jgi:hypothetical protein
MRGLALMLALAAGVAHAHRPSDAFLTLDVDGAQVRGQWEVALRDLAAIVPLDPDGDARITWGELRGAQAGIAAALVPALALRGDGRSCPLRVSRLQVNDRVDGRYAWIGLAADCPAPPAELALDYRLLFDVDPTHRGLLVLTGAGATHSAIFAPQSRSARLRLAEPSALRAFGDYLVEGARHIWIGADHVLFLLSLLLPSVLRRESGTWQGVERVAPAAWDVAAVVTAFTLAHSVTLSLSALDVLRLPSAWVECAIALSVLLAALNNLRPVVSRRRWAMAFAFGLVHGFGFASVLGELGLPDGARLLALVAFNLGVELGQLAIVAVAVPLAFALRGTAFYRRGVVAGGSLLIAAVAIGWLAQRGGEL